MSITLGSAPDPRPATILIGGTESGREHLATAAYRAWDSVARMSWTQSVWPDIEPLHPLRHREAKVADWPGGVPVKWFGFPVRDTRRVGVRNTIDLALSCLDSGTQSIALVGFSHGGSVAIRALEEMLRIHAFRDVTFRLVTISTPPLRDTIGAAWKVASSPRVKWFGMVDREDSVVGTFAGLLEHYAAGTRMSFECEHGFRMLATDRKGIPAHDGLPGSPECREAVRIWFSRQAEEG